MVAAGACQFGPVAISTASISSRASSSRMSMYAVQSLLPLWASTMSLARWRLSPRTSQMAAHCKSGSRRKQPSTYRPRFPIPMAPSTIRSLAATLPCLPMAVPGITCGAARQTPACTAVLRNRRRLRLTFSLHILDLLLGKKFTGHRYQTCLMPLFSYTGIHILKRQSSVVIMPDLLNRGSLSINNISGQTSGKYSRKSYFLQSDSLATDSGVRGGHGLVVDHALVSIYDRPPRIPGQRDLRYLS